jgi:hypothetical protein
MSKIQIIPPEESPFKDLSKPIFYESPDHRLQRISKRHRLYGLIGAGVLAGVLFTTFILPYPTVILIGALFGGFCGYLAYLRLGHLRF